MAIYIHIDGIQGCVTAKGHENWIELETCDIEVNREIKMETGNATNRESRLPSFTEMVVTKKVDKSSPNIFDRACRGKSIGDVKIDICDTNNELQPYAQYKLSDVIISKYSDSMHNEGLHFETMHLNYTRIEKVYIPRDAKNKAGSPMRTGYNIEEAVAA